MVSHNLRFRFTLVSYNILSQTLLNDHHYLYNSCNPRDLEWPRRGHKIVKELLNNQADIICLQEVECEHLRSLYRPKLAHYGYECLYKKKTGYKVDGCAIFYKSKLFHLLSHKGIEFNRTDVAHCLDRDNVGIIAILKPRIQTKSESSHLIIANTHLIFNPKRSDIKLAQLKFFLSELENFSQQTCPNQLDNNSTTDASQQSTGPGVTHRCDHATILCGDLNSTPDSEVSKYILRNTTLRRDKMTRKTTTTTTTSPPTGTDRSELCHNVNDLTIDDNIGLDNENDDSAIAQHRPRPSSNGSDRSPDETLNRPMDSHLLSDFNHLLEFKSVFPACNRAGHKYVSTFSSEIVDYIFYTPKLKLDSYKELLTETQLEAVGPIPNADFPSDHITLGAKFVLK